MTASLVFPDNTSEYALQQRQLEARKAAAAKLVQDAMTSNGGAGMAGNVYMVGNQYGNLAKSLGGTLMGAMADRDQQNLQVSQNAAQQDFNEAYRNAPDDATRQNLLVDAQGKGLRTDLHQAFLKAEQDRIERGEQLAADRVAKAEEAEANRIERGEQQAADRVAREDLRRIPAQSVHVSVSGGGGKGKAPSGYEWDGDNLRAIKGGPADKQPGTKPLTQKQLDTQRGFMDMASSLDTYEQMLDRYDPQGKTAASPTERAALESAFTDVQMKLKTLYELGAPQAGDMRLLEQSFNNPTSVGGTLRGAVFGKDPFKAKVGQIRQLLKNSQANFEKQMGKATPDAAKPPAAPPAGRVRVNSKAEFDALPAGSKWETPDGKRGTK